MYSCGRGIAPPQGIVAKGGEKVYYVSELLPRCERLILASRRAISQCRVVFPAAPSVRCRYVATSRRYLI